MNKLYLTLITIFIIFYSSFLLLRRTKYSYWYRPNVASLELEKEERINQAKNFFRVAHKSTNVLVRNVSLCIGVLTTPRALYSTHRYLLQSVYSILSSIKHTRQSVYISILSSTDEFWNYRKDLNDHLTDLEIITPFVDFVESNKVHESSTHKGSPRAWLRKESLDYLKILEICNTKVKSDSTLIIEDDSFAASNLVEKIRHIRSSIHSNFGSKTNKVAYVKLFASEFFFGFENADSPYLIAAACIIAFVMNKTCLRPNRFVSLLFGISFIVTLEAIGKQNLVDPFHRVGLSSIPLSSIDSNTVAVLFVNRSKVEGLMSFMRTALSKQTNLPQTDLILDNWSRANRYYRLFTIPSLFQHTGIISSKPWKSHGLHRINPHSKNEIYELLYKHVKTSRTFDGFKLE